MANDQAGRPFRQSFTLKRAQILELDLRADRAFFRTILSVIGIGSVIAGMLHISESRFVSLGEISLGMFIVILSAVAARVSSRTLGHLGIVCLAIAIIAARMSVSLREPDQQVGGDNFAPEAVLLYGLMFCAPSFRQQCVWAVIFVAGTVGIDYYFRGLNGVSIDGVTCILIGLFGSVGAGHIILSLTNRGQDALGELFVHARSDRLTGLPNRKYFEEVFAREQSEGGRDGTVIAICLIDVDHFKNVNDKLGHSAGDAVLFKLGTLLSDVVRQSDFVARWGGEEFIVLLHEEDRSKAFLAADRIRTAIASTKIEIGLDKYINITASIGLALANQMDSLNATVANADSALYQSKASGRNQTTAFDPAQSATGFGHLL